jgi:hypothetical protein
MCRILCDSSYLLKFSFYLQKYRVDVQLFKKDVESVSTFRRLAAYLHEFAQRPGCPEIRSLESIQNFVERLSAPPPAILRGGKNNGKVRTLIWICDLFSYFRIWQGPIKKYLSPAIIGDTDEDDDLEIITEITKNLEANISKEKGKEPIVVKEEDKDVEV